MSACLIVQKRSMGDFRDNFFLRIRKGKVQSSRESSMFPEEFQQHSHTWFGFTTRGSFIDSPIEARTADPFCVWFSSQDPSKTWIKHKIVIREIYYKNFFYSFLNLRISFATFIVLSCHPKFLSDTVSLWNSGEFTVIEPLHWPLFTFFLWW